MNQYLSEKSPPWGSSLLSSNRVDMPDAIARTFNEDSDLIRDIVAGNKEAFSALVDKYQGRVRGYCLNFFADADLAQDAAQEIFIKAYRGLSRFNGRSAFSTWLYRITVNHCNDLLRKKMRQKTESWEALLEKDGDRIEAMLAVEPGVKDALGHGERVDRILGCLPEKARSVIVLREIQGLSYQEMADALDCSVDSIKARLRRARREIEIKMRHLLKETSV